MPDEQRSCVLRTLTLCDGQVAVESGARARPCECYCARLERAGDGTPQRSTILHALARAVAQSPAIMRTVQARRRLNDW